LSNNCPTTVMSRHVPLEGKRYCADLPLSAHRTIRTRACQSLPRSSSCRACLRTPWVAENALVTELSKPAPGGLCVSKYVSTRLSASLQRSYTVCSHLGSGKQAANWTTNLDVRLQAVAIPIAAGTVPHFDVSRARPTDTGQRP